MLLLRTVRVGSQDSHLFFSCGGAAPGRYLIRVHSHLISSAADTYGIESSAQMGHNLRGILLLRRDVRSSARSKQKKRQRR
jgi:hypothetical protein